MSVNVVCRLFWKHMQSVIKVIIWVVFAVLYKSTYEYHIWNMSLYDIKQPKLVTSNALPASAHICCRTVVCNSSIQFDFKDMNMTYEWLDKPVDFVSK